MKIIENVFFKKRLLNSGCLLKMLLVQTYKWDCAEFGNDWPQREAVPVIWCSHLMKQNQNQKKYFGAWKKWSLVPPLWMKRHKRDEVRVHGLLKDGAPRAADTHSSAGGWPWRPGTPPGMQWAVLHANPFPQCPLLWCVLWWGSVCTCHKLVP